MTYVVLFFAGALLCNAIPHLAAGLRGEPFPTPFARPRGVGPSSPLVNFYWGSFNLAIGGALAWWQAPHADCCGGLIAGAFGWLAIGTHLAWHFGRVRRGDA